MRRIAWAKALLGITWATTMLAAQASRDGVEPAELLEPGECELEALGKRFRGGDRALQVEAACWQCS